KPRGFQKSTRLLPVAADSLCAQRFQIGPQLRVTGEAAHINEALPGNEILNVRSAPVDWDGSAEEAIEDLLCDPAFESLVVETEGESIFAQRFALVQCRSPPNAPGRSEERVGTQIFPRVLATAPQVLDGSRQAYGEGTVRGTVPAEAIQIDLPRAPKELKGSHSLRVEFLHVPAGQPVAVN